MRDGSESPNLFVKFEYDGLNRRVRKVKYDADAEEAVDSWNLRSGWQAIEERDLDDEGVVLLRHIF